MSVRKVSAFSRAAAPLLAALPWVLGGSAASAQSYAVVQPIPSPASNDLTQALQRLARSPGDFDALMLADRSFHRTIILLANHSLLLLLWDNLFLRIQQVMALRNSANRDIRQVARNHPPIIAALEARDTALALKLIRDHTRSAADIDINSVVFQR